MSDRLSVFSPTYFNNLATHLATLALLAPQQERLLWLIDMMEVGRLLKSITALQHAHTHTRTQSTPCFVTCGDFAVSSPLVASLLLRADAGDAGGKSCCLKIPECLENSRDFRWTKEKKPFLRFLTYLLEGNDDRFQMYHSQALHDGFSFFF